MEWCLTIGAGAAPARDYEAQATPPHLSPAALVTGPTVPDHTKFIDPAKQQAQVRADPVLALCWP